MNTLDVSPMFVALRTAPDQFEVRSRWLRHLPSQHSFAFDEDGHVAVHARCNCAMLRVSHVQEKQLREEFVSGMRTTGVP